MDLFFLRVPKAGDTDPLPAVEGLGTGQQDGTVKMYFITIPT